MQNDSDYRSATTSTYYIGVDPAFRNVGLTLFDAQGTLLYWDVIRTRRTPGSVTSSNIDAALTIIQGLQDFYNVVREEAGSYKVDCVWVVEMPTGSQNDKAAMLLGYVSGILLTFAATKHNSVVPYTQQALKKYVAGTAKKVPKNLIMDYVLGRESNIYMRKQGKATFYRIQSALRDDEIATAHFEHLADSIVLVRMHFADTSSKRFTL